MYDKSAKFNSGFERVTYTLFKFVSVYQTLQGCTRNMDLPSLWGTLSLALPCVTGVTLCPNGSYSCGTR